MNMYFIRIRILYEYVFYIHPRKLHNTFLSHQFSITKGNPFSSAATSNQSITRTYILINYCDDVHRRLTKRDQYRSNRHNKPCKNTSSTDEAGVFSGRATDSKAKTILPRKKLVHSRRESRTETKVEGLRKLYISINVSLMLLPTAKSERKRTLRPYREGW